MSREKAPRFPGAVSLIYELATPAATTTAAWTAATRSTGAACATTSGAPLGLRTRFVHHKIAVAEEPAIEHLDRLGRFLFGRHLDESEASRTPGELTGHDTNRLYRAGLLEELAEILLRGLERKIADEQLCGHRLPPAAMRAENRSPRPPAAHGDDSP